MTLPRIIALATLKGGSGKSTLAACLAAHWRDDEHRPALIDADPQGSLAGWQEGAPLSGVPVIADSSENVSRTARQLAEKHRPVIIDTAGFRNRTTIEALAAADLAVVPVKPSPLDVKVALQTFRLIEEISATKERAGRPIAVRFLFSMTTPGSVISRHIRAELEGAGFPCLAAEVANRVAYGEAALNGSTPTQTEPHGAAAREIAAIAREIEAVEIATSQPRKVSK